MSSLLLTARIEGASEEMECEGRGCERCSFAVRPVVAWACVATFREDPFDPNTTMGRDDDQGRAFLRADVEAAVIALKAEQAALRGSDVERFERRREVALALRLFEVAHAHDMPVRMGS